MKFSMTFELLEEGVEYQLFCAGYTPGTPMTRDYPGDGPEAEIDNEINVLKDGQLVGKIEFKEFITKYADYHKVTFQVAEEKVADEFLCGAQDQYEQDWESSWENGADDGY